MDSLAVSLGGVGRELLAVAADGVNGSEPYGGEHGEGGSSYHIPFTFEELLMLCSVLWIIYLFGRLAGFLGLPELIGHIVAGILVGPHGLEIAPKPDALMLAGELGLVLMVMEAGMEVDLAQLRVVGARGVGVAFVGSLVPLAIGTGVGYGFFSLPIREALAAGASLAPTSMGISLKVLSEGNVLSTPIGQLIIAAAVIDDVIALVLLAELEALENPTAANFIVPIVSSVAFIFGLGSLAVFAMPRVLRWALGRVPERYMPAMLLGGVLLTAYGLLPATHYGKTSYLLGAFLGGLCFCTAEPLMPIWHNNAFQILSWLLRVFFACTLGFEVPIRELWTPTILLMTAGFLLAFFGKLVTGLFATPLTGRSFTIIGFAMSAWGEFAFIVATTAREMGSMSDNTFGAIVLAVLLSAFYSPLAVQLTIAITGKGGMQGLRRRMRLPCAAEPPKADQDIVHRVYYKMALNVRSGWGLTDKLMRELHRLELDIVEFHIKSVSRDWSSFLIFLADRKLRAPRLPPSAADGDPGTVEVAEQVQHIRCSLAELLGYSAEDLAERDGSTADGGLVLTVERFNPELDDSRPEDDDKLAFEQAHRSCIDGPAEDEAPRPPKTLGGLVRQSVNLARTSMGYSGSGGAGTQLQPQPSKRTQPRLSRASMAASVNLDRTSPAPSRFGKAPEEGLAPGKKFSLARVSGQPMYMANLAPPNAPRGMTVATSTTSLLPRGGSTGTLGNHSRV
eukprot:CAMPEP_0177755130 /NCGR_PEP_ID=MMETSP0491_2-20121128/2399_1 /TAXON_ID=63592 /ORGANISM="Tetraselmis chuii, Strain PLY429" /LENGTH=733 /DNA_ID=CAMNT_0019270601 /DNA_START=292 /DNA_END=2493 /DNA_ORIENTATION=+